MLKFLSLFYCSVFINAKATFSRERRDPDTPSKTPESKKFVPVQNKEHAKTLNEFKSDKKKSRLSKTSGRVGKRLSGTSDKRQSCSSDKNQCRISASGERVDSGTCP